jgi:hypothetical protein
MHVTRAEAFSYLAGGLVAVAIGWYLGGSLGHGGKPPEHGPSAIVKPEDGTGAIRSAPPAAPFPPAAPTAVRPAPPPAQPPTKPPEPAAARPGMVEGAAQVVDTVTLRVADRIVHLYGLEWARGANVDDMVAYLSGRTLRCEVVIGDAYRCLIGDLDLSRAVLFNGGARATFDAPADLKDAEAKAKAAKRGIWKDDAGQNSPG